MPRASGARRHPARYLAPVALLVVIGSTYLVVEHGLQKTPARKSHSAPVQQLTRRQRHYVHQRFYIVAPGDSLTAIATKTGVPVGTIQSLNPRIDPNALQPGQRVRIRR